MMSLPKMKRNEVVLCAVAYVGPLHMYVYACVRMCVCVYVLFYSIPFCLSVIQI